MVNRATSVSPNATNIPASKQSSGPLAATPQQTISAVLVDDEKLASDEHAYLLKEFADVEVIGVPDVEIEHAADTPSAAVSVMTSDVDPNARSRNIPDGHPSIGPDLKRPLLIYFAPGRPRFRAGPVARPGPQPPRGFARVLAHCFPARVRLHPGRRTGQSRFLNEAESSSLALRLADLPKRGFDASGFPSRRPPATC